jgi:hypothetical protein
MPLLQRDCTSSACPLAPPSHVVSVRSTTKMVHNRAFQSTADKDRALADRDCPIELDCVVGQPSGRHFKHQTIRYRGHSHRTAILRIVRDSYAGRRRCSRKRATDWRARISPVMSPPRQCSEVRTAHRRALFYCLMCSIIDAFPQRVSAPLRLRWGLCGQSEFLYECLTMRPMGRKSRLLRKEASNRAGSRTQLR